MGPKCVLGLTPAYYYQPRTNFYGWFVQQVNNIFSVTGVLTDDEKFGRDGLKNFQNQH